MISMGYEGGRKGGGGRKPLKFPRKIADRRGTSYSGRTMVKLIQILNADLHEIVNLHLGREDRSTFAGFYVSVLKHYLTDDMAALEKLLNRIEASKLSLEEKRTLSVLGRARFAARQAQCGEGELRDLLEYMPEEGPMRGEFYYVLALCFESMGRTREMSDAYHAASQAFRTTGVKQKAVKALFNHISAEHRLHPDK